MSVQPAAKRTRRWRRATLVFALLLTALGALYASRNRVLAPWIVSRLATKLRADQGLELEVGTVGGDWFSTLELTDVRVAKLDGSLRVALRELSASFSLVELASQGPLAIEFVRVRGLDVDYDLERRAPKSGAAEGGGGGAFVWPERWPKLVVEGAHVALALGGGRKLELTDLALDCADGERFAARAASASFVSPETRWPAAACAAEWRMQGGRVELTRLALAEAEVLERGSIDLTEVGAGRIAWDADLTLDLGGIASRGTLHGAALAAGVAFEAVDGASLCAHFPPLARAEWSGTLDLEAQIQLEFASGGAFELAVRGAARDGAFGPERFERLTTELVVTRSQLLFSRLDVQRGANRVVATDLAVPFDLTNVGALRGRVSIDSTDVPGLIGSPELGEDVPAHQVHLAATFTEDGVILDEGRVSTETGVLDVDAGRVVFGATKERWLADARFDLAGRADFPDLSELGGALGREGWCGSASGRVALSGGLETLEGVLDLAGSNVELEGFLLGDVQASARVDRQRVRVARARASGEWGEFELAGELDYRARRIFDTTAAARLTLPVPWVPSTAASGTLELHAFVEGELAAPRVDFAISAREVTFAGRSLDSLDVRGLWEGVRVRVDHLVAKAYGVAVVATGELSSLDWNAPYLVTLESLRAERAERALDLVAPMEIRIGEQALDFDRAHFAGNAGRWIAACHWSPESTVVNAELVELTPLGLFRPFLPEGVDVDRLHGKFEVSRVGERLTAAVDLQVERARFEVDGQLYSLAVRGLLDGERLDLAALELSDGERRVLSLSGTAPFDPLGASPFAPGKLELSGSVALRDLAEIPVAWRPRGLVPTGGASVDFRLGGTWREPSGRIELAACDLELEGVGEIAGRRLGPWDVDLALTFDQSVRIERLEVEERGRARASVAGEVLLAPRVLDWLEQGPPELADIGLDLVASAAVDDLSIVRALSPALGRVGGSAFAEVAVGASLAAPTWSGSVQLADGEVRFDSDLPRLSNLNADIALSGYSATLRSCSGALGAGPFQASGRVELRDGRPHFDLQATGQELLLVRGDNLRLRADARITLTGPIEALRLGGELALRDGRFTRNFELLDRISGSTQRASGPQVRGFALPVIARGPLAQAEFDVAVRCVEPLRIDNNLLHVGLRPNLRLLGRGAAPTLSGSIVAEDARISLPTGALRMTSGTVILPAANPVVPVLRLRGQVRVGGYDVSVTLDGDYDEPIVLSSSPPLSQSELVVLLLTGQPPAGSFSATSERAAQSMAVFLGQDVLTRWLSSEDASGESLVERIEWLQGQEITESGGQTTQVSLRLTDDDGSAKRVVYLRGETDVYDRVNFGVKWVFRRR